MIRAVEEFAPAAERRAVKAWLAALRKTSGKSQADIAALLGVSRETISNAERAAGSLPQGLTMVRYLRALGVVADAPVSLPGLSHLEALRGAVAEVQSTLTDDVVPDLSDVLARLERLEAALSPGQDHPNDQAALG